MDRVIRWLVLIGRLAMGAVFVYAAYTKLRNPWMLFAMSVDSYHMLSESGVELVARALPWVELVLGAMLILGLWVRWAAAGVSALLVVLVYAIVRAYSMRLEINCGCFGTNEPLTKFTIVRDSGFLAASIVLTVLAFLAHRRARARQSA
ncbi:MAG: DoxX family protein [Candidatus Acidiferrales bacterium]